VDVGRARRRGTADHDREWLVPASEPARDAVHTATGGRNGWEATPALQRYLAGPSGLPTLQRELTDGWTQVSGG
jgi:hypothetical protein